jgi:hypothetical protein
VNNANSACSTQTMMRIRRLGSSTRYLFKSLGLDAGQERARALRVDEGAGRISAGLDPAGDTSGGSASFKDAME